VRQAQISLRLVEFALAKWNGTQLRV
jgi:hypothetical protein